MIELELFSCPISSCFILFSTSAMPCHLTRDVAAPADVPRMRHIPSLGEATPSWTKGEATKLRTQWEGRSLTGRKQTTYAIE